MLAKHQVGKEACAELSGMIIAFVNRKPKLPDQKKRAIKVLAPFSLLPAPKAGAKAGVGAAPETKPKPKTAAPAPKPEAAPEAPAPAVAPKVAAEEEKGPAEQQRPAGPGFEELLIKYLAKHILMRMIPFQLPDSGKDPQPFYSKKIAN